MSSPAVPDTLVDAAAAFLAGQPSVLAVLGSYPGTSTPFLFRYEPWVVLEHTQSTACVLRSGGGWIAPNPHNTMRFPRLQVEILADPLRDSGRNVIDPPEVQRRIEHAYTVIDRVLHRPQGGAQQWGTLRVLGCLRNGEPQIDPVRDGSGLLRLTVAYAVTAG